MVADLPGATLALEGDVIVAVNDAACDLLGAPGPTETVGTDLGTWFDEGSTDALRACIRAASGAPDAATSLVVPSPDGARHLTVRLRRSETGEVLAALDDATEFFRVLMMLAWSSNVTLVLDEAAGIRWGPVGRYAAEALDSPWYGRGDANPLAWIHPEDIPHVLDGFNRVLAKPGVVHELSVRTRHVLIDDLWGVATLRAINLLDDPLVGGVLVQTQAEGESERIRLGRTTGSFTSIADAAPIGIIVSDHLGRALYWNEVARGLFDLGPTDNRDGVQHEATDWPGLAGVEHRDELRGLLNSALGGQRGSLVARFDLPEDGSKWLQVTVAPQLNDLGDPMGWIATLQDLTTEILAREELERATARLEHLASHDPLTGLANRVLLSVRAEGALGTHRDHPGFGVALLFIDLDGYKSVNDEHGHDTGDAVLVEVARRIEAAVRPGDLAARMGGDEFVVLVQGFVDRDEVAAVAGRLVEAVAEPVEVGPVAARVGASIGVAVADEDDDVESLLRRADDRMYRAKAAGRGRYVLDG